MEKTRKITEQLIFELLYMIETTKGLETDREQVLQEVNSLLLLSKKESNLESISSETLRDYIKGIIYLHNEQYAAALDTFEKLYNIQTAIPLPIFVLSYNAAGVVKLLTSDYDVALELFDEALSHCYDYAYAYLFKTIIHLKMHDYSLALENANESIKYSKNYSIDAVKKVALLMPNFPGCDPLYNSFYLKKMVYEELGDSEQAQLNFDYAVRSEKSTNQSEAQDSEGLYSEKQKSQVYSDFNMIIVGDEEETSITPLSDERVTEIMDRYLESATYSNLLNTFKKQQEQIKKE